MKVLNITHKVIDTEVTKYTCGFRENKEKNHKGVDLIPKSTSETPAVLAYDAGTVIQVQNYKGTTESTKNPGMGTSCAIRHADGTVTRYQHLKADSLRVKKGDTVKRGQVLGTYGRPTTGNSTGPHLHFDISLPAKPAQDCIKSTFCSETRYYVDPIPYLTKSAAVKMTVTAGTLNVRSGPSMNNKIIDKIHSGDKVTVYEVQNNFGRIGSGRWCSMDWLK